MFFLGNLLITVYLISASLVNGLYCRRGSLLPRPFDPHVVYCPFAVSPVDDGGNPRPRPQAIPLYTVSHPCPLIPVSLLIGSTRTVAFKCPHSKDITIPDASLRLDVLRTRLFIGLSDTTGLLEGYLAVDRYQQRTMVKYAVRPLVGST